MDKRKKWTQIILIGGLVMTLALGALAFVPQAVMAQDEEPEEPTTPWSAMRGPGGPGRGGKGGFGGAIDNDTYLAAALGISVEELQAARETARAAALEEAIAQGYITAEQVEMMEARQAVMGYMDPEALREELGELEPGDMREAMQAAFADAVQQALDNGDIDQDQADRMLERGLGGKFGGRGGRSGPGGNPPPEFDTEESNDL